MRRTRRGRLPVVDLDQIHAEEHLALLGEGQVRRTNDGGKGKRRADGWMERWVGGWIDECEKRVREGREEWLGSGCVGVWGVCVG
eukprot:1482527-Rhodomonas_salina.2